ncbi:MAG TPA: sigma 54-interacting transcriptional regulator [Candidatus Competibacter sp.]|nr:sigma 54-interacting transcriptional regulator [Candidatus Competibacter sp.]
MKILDIETEPASTYGGLLEKIEILRSTLRWATQLDASEIQNLLRQCNDLRDDVVVLSRKERFEESADVELKETATVRSPQQRRKALLDRSFIFEGIFGESPKLLETLEIAAKVAPTDLPVLIGGESGTGKELLAKVVHANGNRAGKPFISVNCGAIPADLLESELFGHVKGAFTGAAGDRKGKFEIAHHGTIFLDEIGELPLPGQVKLLRVLQSQEIQRVGSDALLHVDTRVIAATNRDLRQMVQEGRFREDLFYRLGVIDVTLPPLRERSDEIPLLLEYFCGEAAEKLHRQPMLMTPHLYDFLMNYTYPGNIRELRNIVFRLSCLADGTADLNHLPEAIRLGVATETNATAEPTACLSSSLSDAKKIATDKAEKRYLEDKLRGVRGNVAELARQIDMNRSYLQILLKKHGIRSKDFRSKK